MHHLLGFFGNHAAVTDTQLNAIADEKYSRSNNSFQIPVDHKILLLYAGSAGLSRARINTPSLRLRGFPQITPIETTLLPPTDPNVMDLRDNPLQLVAEEDFRIDITKTGVASDVAAFAWLSKSEPNYNVNQRDLRWLRFTATVTAVAGGWSNVGAVTLEDTIKSGRYAVYGLWTQGANILAARLVLADDLLRPGCLGSAALGNRSHAAFRGGLGVWGYFNTYSLPQIQTCETAAGASTVEGKILVAGA